MKEVGIVKRDESFELNMHRRLAGKGIPEHLIDKLIEYITRDINIKNNYFVKVHGSVESFNRETTDKTSNIYVETENKEKLKHMTYTEVAEMVRDQSPDYSRREDFDMTLLGDVNTLVKPLIYYEGDKHAKVTTTVIQDENNETLYTVNTDYDHTTIKDNRIRATAVMTIINTMSYDGTDARYEVKYHLHILNVEGEEQ